MTPSTFVATIDTKKSDSMIKDLEEMGFEITRPQYTCFSAKKKGVSCTLYTSGKLTVQGKEMAEFIEFYLEPHVLQSFEFSNPDHKLDKTRRIGIDESGKGDFFGPLTIAGVFAEEDMITNLRKFGVKDSKAMNDNAILKVAKKIRENTPHHIVKINPQKYNELYKQFGNLNRLLAWGHATTIESLTNKTGCRRVIVDQFADERVVESALKKKGLHLDLFQRHRAEEDLVVAAASILAREAFVLGLKSLEEEFGLKLPKGASQATIAAGKKLLREKGRGALEKVGKLHFKTLDAILD